MFYKKGCVCRNGRKGEKLLARMYMYMYIRAHTVPFMYICTLGVYSIPPDDSEEVGAYEDLKSQYMKHTQDFLTMSKIACLVSSLADTYTVREHV